MKFTLTLSDEERSELTRLARADGRTMAGWIRAKIRSQAAKLI